MSNKNQPNSKQTKNHDQKIVEPNAFLETQKKHKDWYDANQMGKQGNKPQRDMKQNKKASGTRKHSLRKEK